MVLVVINLADTEAVREQELRLWLSTVERLAESVAAGCRVLVVGTP